jgi:PKD repeat protein
MKNYIYALVAVVLGLLLITPVYSLTVDCEQANALDSGDTCSWPYSQTGTRCCCWCPDPTGGHAFGHVMDLGAPVSDVDVNFEIRPGAGDGGCVTNGYMYYSLDGSTWTLFWSSPLLNGWTTYSGMVHVSDTFRYLRANTDGCSVDLAKVTVNAGSQCSIVGQWDWNTAQDPAPPGTWVIDFHEDGTLYYDGIYYGTWQLMSENPQVYYLSWTHGYYDTLTMSSDCQMLDGYNQNGLHVYAYRRSTNPPPVADFEATPTSGSAPLKVTFTDKSTGDGITSRVWQFKLNSDSTWTTFTLDKKSSHKFINDGIYDVKLTVTGSGGSDEEIKTEYINVNEPLIADFEIYPRDDPTTTTYKPAGKTIPMVGGLIRFDARKSTGDIEKYRWDFGDNEGLIETDKPTFEYIYSKEKTYKIKLEIVDKNGNTAKKKGEFTIPKLEPGDIIFCNTKGNGGWIPGFYTHTGIYIGNGKIVESVGPAGHGLPANGVGESDIMVWSYPTETAVAVYRPMISDRDIQRAVKEAKGFVRQKPHIIYDLAFVQKSQQPDALYCSELVWAAYSLASGGEGHWTLGGLTWIDTYGRINLGYMPSPLGVTPSDIADDPRLQYVAGHWEDEPGSPN